MRFKFVIDKQPQKQNDKCIRSAHLADGSVINMTSLCWRNNETSFS